MHIDRFAIVTNGILATDDSIRIIDPLGYFVIKIEEIIVPVDDGGGSAPTYDQALQEERRKKIIRVTVTSEESEIDYTKEVELTDINFKVTGAKLVNNEIILDIYNPVLQITEQRTIKLKVDK